MAAARRFSRTVVAAIHESKILGVRAGIAPHRFLGVWVVVVEGRVFVRSWNDDPAGWHRVFQDEPRGAIQIAPDREIRVRASKVRSERLLAAIDRAYAEKYPTLASRKYVLGLKRPKRRRTTTELGPR
jgi:hypothetical protein